jgi:2-phospho-L-lactate guanylyltransferase
MSTISPVRFCVVVPVKPPARAKTRLTPLGEETRRALVTAFARDTVSAALASALVGEVLVVTDDHVLARGARDLGAEVVPDGVADDLNATLVQGAAEGQRRRPDLLPVALCADLPALRAQELTLALEVASTHPTAFVLDVAGDGTTMFAAATGERFTPRFGAGSAHAHRSGGAHEIVEVHLPTLRRDVDTPDDLRDALSLGVGEHTARACAGVRL